MSEMPEVLAYTVYQWDCDCGNVNTSEHDPSGEEVMCEDCGETSIVSETK